MSPPPGVPDWAKIAAIDVSASADGVAYVVADNQRQGDLSPRVFATKDGGATWRDATGDLPRDHFVAVVRSDPARAGLLYAGTEIGVYVSYDDGGHWSALQGNLPTAWVRDLLVHGDDLIAATQGRAIWTLGDLALLRQHDPAFAKSPLRLFTPAQTVRVRTNTNRDTPLPPDEPAGENPPAGALIDYWLGSATKTAASLEIRDAAGDLVQRLTSAATTTPSAEQYFSDRWLRPNPGLASTPGLHRVVWNLRWARPAAIEYTYSIATAAGTDTSITPEGPLALPGVYRLTLSANGKTTGADLTLLADPRSPAPDADRAASLALSRKIGAGLARARQGFGEMAMARDDLLAVQASMKAKAIVGSLSGRVDDMIKRATASITTPNFQVASAILAAIETDLEGADLAPSEPQLNAVAGSLKDIDALWAGWTAIRDHDLASLNGDLTKAGYKAVILPPPDRLIIKPATGGADLP